MKKKAHFFLLLFLFFALSQCSGLASENEDDLAFPFMGMVDVQDLNLRTDSTVSSISVIKLNKGEKLVVVGRKYDWFKVRFPDRVDCYISSDYLDFSGKEGIIKAENLNVRLGPGFEYSIVGTVSRGTTVRLKSDKGRDWTCVYPVSNCYGWVNKKHISKAKAIFAEEETLEESRRKIKIVLESFQPQEEEINTPDEITTQNDSNEFPLEKENDFTADEIDVEEEETINATVEDEKPEEKSVSISETPGYVSVMGYIEDLGKILFRPGKYKLVDDWGNVLYYLAGKEVDLKGFIYGKVKIQGIRKNNYYHSIPILEVKKAEYINQ